MKMAISSSMKRCFQEPSSITKMVSLVIGVPSLNVLYTVTPTSGSEAGPFTTTLMALSSKPSSAANHSFF